MKTPKTQKLIKSLEGKNKLDALKEALQLCFELEKALNSQQEGAQALIEAVETYFDGNDRRPTMQICGAVRELREAIQK